MCQDSHLRDSRDSGHRSHMFVQKEQLAVVQGPERFKNVGDGRSVGPSLAFCLKACILQSVLAIFQSYTLSQF